jgi:hypothetical protein
MYHCLGIGARARWLLLRFAWRDIQVAAWERL